MDDAGGWHDPTQVPVDAPAGRPDAAPAWGAAGPPPTWGHASWSGPPPAPRPGVVPLRPLGLGEVYDGAFQAIRRNPRTMLATTAVVLAVTSLLSALLQAGALVSLSSVVSPSSAEPQLEDVVGTLVGASTSLLVPALVQGLVLVVLTGVLVVAVSRAVLGRATSTGELWREVRGRVPALVGLSLLVGAATVAAVVLPLLPAAGLGAAWAASGDGGAAAGFFAALVLGLLGSFAGYCLVATRLAVAPAALLLERLRVLAAVRRSWRLVGSLREGQFWRVLGIWLLTLLLTSVVSAVLSVPFSLLSSLVAVGQGPEDLYSDLGLTLLQLGVANVGTVVAGTLVYPFTAGVTALLYVDLRMRREGLDVELARAAGERA